VCQFTLLWSDLECHSGMSIHSSSDEGVNLECRYFLLMGEGVLECHRGMSIHSSSERVHLECRYFLLMGEEGVLECHCSMSVHTLGCG
jgi:hypothetical protein